MVRQAQSREKLLQKKLEEGLTEKPQRDAEWDFSFPDPGAEPASSYATVTPSSRPHARRRAAHARAHDPRRVLRLPW